MHPYKCLWVVADFYASLWIPMAPYGSLCALWVHMVPYRSKFVAIDFNGFLLVLISFYSSLIYLIGLYGFLYVLMCFYGI